jgi:hypothetical protein
VALFAAVHMSLPGTFETSTDVRYTAAFGGKADSASDCQTIAIYEYTPLGIQRHARAPTHKRARRGPGRIQTSEPLLAAS